MNKPVFNRIYAFLLVFAIFLVGCDRCDYDNGREAAWEGESGPSFWSSKEFKEGYEQGLCESAMYDDGYDDGYDKKKPEYLNDLDYMDGYKDGKNDKKKGL